jgi:hypothetical protein
VVPVLDRGKPAEHRTLDQSVSWSGNWAVMPAARMSASSIM